MDILSEIFEGTKRKSGTTLKDRCAVDLELFCRTYFPDVFTSEFCEFHRDVFSKCQEYVLGGKMKKLKKYMARAAPRGHGKSQIISFGLPLWCICYGYRRNILIVSDTADQAAQFIMDIKIEIEDNDALIRDFGNLVGKETWSTSKIVTANGIHCIGKGAGQKLRGIKYNSIRPDLIIIDDLENDESVETEGQRNKLFNWFMKALLKCGYTNTIFIYIGTILSYESLLYKVLHNKQFAMWDRKIYRAVYKFSKSPLWDEWEQIITGLNDASEDEEDEIAQGAYSFYLEHRDEMLAGVVCLWPEKEPDYYYNLMVERVMDEESFNSEEQNDPITESLREFKLEWIKANLYTQLPEITDVYIGIDAAMTVKKGSDDSAIVVVGRGVDRKLYVMDVFSEKVPVDALIDQLLIYGAAYYEKIRRIAIEDVVFQILLKDLMELKAIESDMYLPFEGIAVRQKKELKLRSLVIPVRNGHFKFREEQKKLIEEMKRFPRGSDNAMDALWIATTGIIGGMGISSFGFGSVGGRKRRR